MTIVWDVWLQNPETENWDLIDTVFDYERDSNEVKRSLVNHDGYDSNISVRRAPKWGNYGV